MYYGKQAPCMICADRKPGCHGGCERYKAFIKNVKNGKQNKKGSQLNMAEAYFGERERAKKVWRRW